jgi:hypothetical protein
MNKEVFSQAQKGTAEQPNLFVLPFHRRISQDLSTFS